MATCFHPLSQITLELNSLVNLGLCYKSVPFNAEYFPVVFAFKDLGYLSVLVGFQLTWAYIKVEMIMFIWRIHSAAFKVQISNDKILFKGKCSHCTARSGHHFPSEHRLVYTLLPKYVGTHFRNIIVMLLIYYLYSCSHRPMPIHT